MTFDRINMDAFEQELVELRRDFHRYAESGWTEFRTTARIITELEKLDLPVKYGPEIHVKEKMYGLPKPEVLNACWQRALGETDHPELVRAMEGGYTAPCPGPPSGSASTSTATTSLSQHRPPMCRRPRASARCMKTACTPAATTPTPP